MAINETGREELFGRVAPADMGLTVDETIGGLALIVLAILSLAGINPALLLSIATIVAGVALLFMSMTLTGEFNKTLILSASEQISADAGQGWSAGTLAGGVGVVLGVLALLGIGGATLMAVSLIVFGAAVFLDFIMMSQARALRTSTAATESTRLAFTAAAGSDMGSLLFGFALVLLGIIALTGLNSGVLIAVAFLALGGYFFLKGTAVVTQMISWRSSWRSA